MSKLRLIYLLTIGNIISIQVFSQSEVHRKESLITNSPVYKIDHSNGYTMLHGYFNRIGTFNGSSIVVDNVNGTADPSWPKISGEINAVQSDGNGGWYVGGYIYSVNNEDVGNLIHILPNKTVDKTWLPNPAGTVKTLLLSNGVLYVGGHFQYVADQTRSFLAAFNTSTGALTSWNPHASHFVYALAVSGNTIFAGGSFTKMNNNAVTREKIAALNNTDGTVISSWDAPVTGTNSAVYSLATNGGNVYIGGFFTAVNGAARSSLAAVSTTDGALNTTWIPNPIHSSTPTISALISDGNTLYIGGTFNGGLGGNIAVKNLGAVTATGTGVAINSFIPAIGPVSSLSLNGSTLYVTGYFGQVNNIPRDRIAAIQTTNGELTSWIPTEVDGFINAVAVNGNTIFIGGEFNGINWIPRDDFAIIDEATGTLWPFTISLPSGEGISTMAVKGTTLFIGGRFSSVNGQSRKNLAAINLTNGSLLPWNPEASGTTATFDDTGVFTMDIKDDLLYIGGIFTTVGGQTRRGLAAINVNSGVPNSWNPVVGNGSTTGQYPKTLHIAGNTVYVGGDFNLLGAQSRTYLGALDANTASLLSWAPEATAPVEKIRVAGNAAYVLGDFSEGVAGAARPHRIAAIDITSGFATPWNPDFDGTQVFDFAISSTDIYVGGYYEKVNNNNRPGLASFSLATGELNPWTPDVGGAVEIGYDVEAVAVSPTRLYIGGGFIRVGNETRVGYAEYDMQVCPASGNLVLQGTTFTAPAADSYQWYLNNEAVSGATSQTFDISIWEYGVYAVEMSVNNCAVRSYDYVYLITGKQTETTSSIKLYPNPAKEEIFIEVPSYATLTVLDMLGKPLKHSDLSFNEPNRIETTDLKSGAYIFLIRSNTVTNTIKVLKTY